jgi:hypothetical protein
MRSALQMRGSLHSIGASATLIPFALFYLRGSLGRVNVGFVALTMNAVRCLVRTQRSLSWLPALFGASNNDVIIRITTNIDRNGDLEE